MKTALTAAEEFPIGSWQAQVPAWAAIELDKQSKEYDLADWRPCYLGGKRIDDRFFQVFLKGDRLGWVYVRKPIQVDPATCKHDAPWNMSYPDDTTCYATCSDCGTVTQRVCIHAHNSWNEERTQLTCDRCGSDGT